MTKKGLSLLLVVALAACVPQPGQNSYNLAESGKAVQIEYATILRAKQVKIIGEQTGAGTVTGGLVGGIAASNIGGGDGALLAAIGGAVIGGIMGSLAEQELQNTVGIEYFIRVDGEKKAKSIVQNQHKEDVVFKKGDRVIVQLQGGYQRVMADE